MEELVLAVDNNGAEFGVWAAEGEAEGFLGGERGSDGVEEATMNASGSGSGDCQLP